MDNPRASHMSLVGLRQIVNGVEFGSYCLDPLPGPETRLMSLQSNLTPFPFFAHHLDNHLEGSQQRRWIVALCLVGA
jgi:hypothetical protein